MVLLSYQRVRRRRAWAKIEEAYRNKTDITGKVVDHIKGGLVVDIGVRAFLPASQADLHPVRDLDEWKDREITVRVLKMNRKRGNVVVSRRAILDEQVAAQRQGHARLDGRRADRARRGEERHRLRRVRGPGRHRRPAAHHGHVLGPRGKPAGRRAPGRGSRSQDPEVRQGKGPRIAGAQAIAARSRGPRCRSATPPGKKLTGKIMGLTDYGAFVELEPGIEGLVHVSEMSWSKRKQHPSKIVKVGDEVEVVVLGVDSNERRISLGHEAGAGRSVAAARGKISGRHGGQRDKSAT